MNDPKETVRLMAQGTAALRNAIPDTMDAFGALGTAAYADGALDEKTKEFLALAIGIATHCEGCIAHHARTLARLGATQNEVSEAIGVAIQMGGGPSMVYGGYALRAYDSFSNQAE